MLHPISRFWRAQPTTQQLANDVSSVLSQKENETIDTLGVYLNKKSVKFLTKKLLHRFWYRAQHDKTTNVKLFMSGLIIVRFPAEALNGNDAVDRNLHDKASTMMDLFTDAAIDPTNTDKIRRFATSYDDYTANLDMWLPIYRSRMYIEHAKRMSTCTKRMNQLPVGSPKWREAQQVKEHLKQKEHPFYK